MILSELVTAVIPVYNRPDDLLELIKSMKILWMVPKSIIIIDDNSQFYNADEFLKNVCSIPIRHIKFCSNVGNARAKNAGIARVKTKYVWFLDSDTVINNPLCLQKMVECLETNPQIGAAGGEIHTAGENQLLSIERVYPNMDTKIDYYKIPHGFDHYPDLIGTNNMLTRTFLINKYGGFRDVERGCDKLYSFWLTRNNYLLYESELFGVIHKKSPTDRKRTYFQWEWFRAKNQIINSILLLSWGELLIFPILDIISKFRYIKDRRKRLKITAGTNTFQMHKGPQKWKKGIIYLTIWGVSYFYGLYFLLMGRKRNGSGN